MTACQANGVELQVGDVLEFVGPVVLTGDVPDGMTVKFKGVAGDYSASAVIVEVTERGEL